MQNYISRLRRFSIINVPPTYNDILPIVTVFRNRCPYESMSSEKELSKMTPPSPSPTSPVKLTKAPYNQKRTFFIMSNENSIVSDVKNKDMRSTDLNSIPIDKQQGMNKNLHRRIAYLIDDYSY